MSDSESDSESSSSEEQTKSTPVVVKKQPVKEVSDSDDSDSDSSDSEEEAPKAKAQPKAVAKKEEESDSDSDSDSEEEAPAAKATPAPVANKDDDSDSDSDSSDDEEEKKTVATPAAVKKEEDSDDDSDSDSSDDEEETKKAPASEKKVEKKTVAEPVKEEPEKMEVEEEEEKVDFTTSLSQSITATPLFVWDMSKGINKGKKRKSESSSSPQVAKKAKVEETSTTTATSTTAATSSTPKPSTPKPTGDMTPVKEFNAYDYKNSHLKGETSTVFIKGIDINAFENDIKEFFSDIEVPLAVRHKWQEDRPGIAFIQFSCPEVATKVVIDKNNEYIKDRYINTDWSEERKPSSGGSAGFGRGPKNVHLKDTTNRVWLGNLHREVYEDSIREMVKPVGVLTDVYIIGRDESRPKIAYISFESNELATKAVETLQGASLMDFNVRFDWAEPRKDGGGARAAKPLSEKPEGCTTVFVGRLADGVDDEKLAELFKEAGEISQIRYMERDGEFRGVAFVEFTESDSTDKAVEKNGTSFLGRSIRVDFSASKKREPRW